MKVSTVDKAIKIYKRIWSVFIIILSLAFLIYGIRVYLNQPEITQIQQEILSEKNIFNLTKGDKVKFGNEIWDVDYTFSGNNKNYYSITLTNY